MSSTTRRRTVIRLTLLVMAFSAVVVACGCASTKVKDRQILVTEKLPRPQHIFVYDFAATAADVPADSALAGQYAQHSTPQTPQDIAAGRQLGAEIAAQLVEEIRAMGLPAERATRVPKPQINDIVIRGYLVSVDEGSAAKRIVLGFGSGSSELTTAVEGFQVTARGMRKLGSGTVQSGGGKSPGAALGLVGFIATANPVGLAVTGGAKAYGEVSGSEPLEGRASKTAQEIAQQIKPRFQYHGWIR